MNFPHRFEVVCQRGHDRAVVATRLIDLDQQTMEADTAEFDPRRDSRGLDRLDGGRSLTCPVAECGLTERLGPGQWSRLVAIVCEQVADHQELLASPGVVPVDLRRIRAILNTT